jgi:hypothetical protein
VSVTTVIPAEALPARRNQMQGTTTIRAIFISKIESSTDDQANPKKSDLSNQVNARVRTDLLEMEIPSRKSAKEEKIWI